MFQLNASKSAKIWNMRAHNFFYCLKKFRATIIFSLMNARVTKSYAYVNIERAIIREKLNEKFHKYGKFWSSCLEHFIEQNPFISEEWTNNPPSLLTYLGGWKWTDFYNLLWHQKESKSCQICSTSQDGLVSNFKIIQKLVCIWNLAQ